jgi:hypothetical protein
LLVGDPQRHVERRDKAEGATALVVPGVVTVVMAEAEVRIERNPPTHFIEAVGEFPTADDRARADGSGPHLLCAAGTHRRRHFRIARSWRCS